MNYSIDWTSKGERDWTQRPAGSNADEWHVFLCERLDNRATCPNGLTYVAVQISEAIETLEKLVYVPGQWRCAKCNFRLTQSNLYLGSGTVGPRDEPGDKCPNCNGPLWRVSAMEDRNEAFKCANDTFERVEKLRAALTEICRIHDQNAPQGALRADFQHIARRALETDQPFSSGERPDG